MGLDDAIYGTVRSNLLSTDPLPSLNRAYSIVIQEERVRTMAGAVDERRDVIALVAQAPYRGKGRSERRDKHQVCSHCNRTGHDSNNCFKIIGYPEWWGDRPREDKLTGQGRGQ